MQFTAYERLLLLNVLPREGDLATLKIVRDLLDRLGFTEAEHQVLQIRQDGDEVHWVREVDTPVEIEVGVTAYQVIQTTLRNLERQKKLRLEHLPLYERFEAEPTV